MYTNCASRSNTGTELRQSSDDQAVNGFEIVTHERSYFLHTFDSAPTPGCVECLKDNEGTKKVETRSGVTIRPTWVVIIVKQSARVAVEVVSKRSRATT